MAEVQNFPDDVEVYWLPDGWHADPPVCMVIWDRLTGTDCKEPAAYRVWPSDDEDLVDLLCPEHAARWRSGGFVRRITTL